MRQGPGIRRLAPRAQALAGLVVTGIVGAVGAPAAAQVVEVRNDSFDAGDAINQCFCFAEGEEAAVWLTSPCDGTIVGFRIWWSSGFGGADPSIEDSIRVYQAGTFPNPGPLIEEFLAPALLDGGLNEFRFEDENQTVPISIPVNQGETFVVSLRFFNDNQNNFFAPTIASDDSGCQSGKNTVKVGGFTWFNACSLGVSGDWVIRALIQCAGEPAGACCLPDGSCANGMTEAACVAADGAWRGPFSACADGPCLGACFIPSTGNCLQFDKTLCEGVGGQWQGPGTTECGSCPADLNNDGIANLDDIALLASTTPDLDQNTVFNIDDLDLFITSFLEGCP